MLEDIVSKLLRNVADKIDDGSISSNPEETIQAMEALKAFVDKDRKLSKYQSYTYLNMSRASFDNHIRAGHISKGQKVSGFKELFWDIKTLDKFKNERHKKNNRALHGNS